MTELSVVLPVYNAARFLPEAIASISAQTLAAFEVIAVDDGSTDDSAAILTDWARSDHRVRIVRHATNQHVASALNTGLAHASGPLVIRADADDVNALDRFAILNAASAANPQLAVIGSAAWMGGRVECFPETAAAIRARMLWDCPFLHPTVLLNRRVLGEVRYDPDFSGLEDVELWWRTVFRHPTMNLRQPLVRYRYRADSVSLRLDEARLRRERTYDVVVARALGLTNTDHAGLACRLGNRVAQMPPRQVTRYVLAVCRRASDLGLAPASALRREALRQCWRFWRFYGRRRLATDLPGVAAATMELLWNLRRQTLAVSA